MFTHLSIYKPFAYHLRRFPNQKIFCYASCFHGVLRFLFLSVEFIILITWFAFLFWHPYSSSYVMNHFYVSPPFVFPPLFSRFSCVVSCAVVFVHARMHGSVCMCVHAHLLTWCSRGGGPSPAQTNSPLSLKAMTSAQTQKAGWACR